jgi:hypothetical protein
MAYICSICLEEYGGRRRYRVCPNCGGEGTVQPIDDRDPDEDDGRSYADPRDERAERRGL